MGTVVHKLLYLTAFVSSAENLRFMHRAGPSSLCRNSYSTYRRFTLVICIINLPYGFFQVKTNVRTSHCTLKEIRVRLSNKKFISKNIYICFRNVAM